MKPREGSGMHPQTSLFRTPLLLCTLVLIPALLSLTGESTLTRIATLTLISIVFVVGLSIYAGNSGNMSFGHTAFMAIGAYITTYLTTPVPLKRTLFVRVPEPLSFLVDVQSGFWVAMVISALGGAALGLLTSPAIARLSGLQSGIATLALLMITYNIISNWTEVTRGSSSVIGIVRGTSVWSALLFACLSIFVAWWYKQSRSGLQLRATREDYWAARAASVDVGRHRALAWILSAAVCGLSGGLYASFVTTFNVNAFFLTATFSFIVMIVIGGYLSLSGAVIGALIVSVLQDVLRRLQDGQFTGGALPPGTADLALAAILLLVLIKAPLGIMGSSEVGEPGARLRWGRRSTDETAAATKGE